MLITINEIPLQQLPAQHRKIHKIIKINIINCSLMQNLKQIKISKKHK